MPQTLQRVERIRRRPEFQEAFERGARVHGRYMTVILLPTERPLTRLGIVASKRVGGAVQRNRAKRLIREVFRRNKAAAALGGVDVVIIARPELVDAEVAAIDADFRSLLRRRATRAAR